MDAYCSHFGLQRSCVQLRCKGIAGDVVLPHRSVRELVFTLGDVFYALCWDPGRALGSRELAVSGVRGLASPHSFLGATHGLFV